MSRHHDDDDAALGRMHAGWERQHGHSHQWDQPPSGIHYGDFTHEALVRIVMRGRPQVTRETSQSWEVLGRSLIDHADAMQTSSTDLGQVWTGAGFSQFQQMLHNLSLAAREAAVTALQMRDMLASNAEALERAQQALAALPPGNGAGPAQPHGPAQPNGAGDGRGSR